MISSLKMVVFVVSRDWLLNMDLNDESILKVFRDQARELQEREAARTG